MTQGYTKGVPIDTDATMANNSNQLVPSQAAVVTYVTNAISAKPDLHISNFIVGAGSGANYTTIGAALSAAGSGQTIYIQPGTYTENLTLKAGVNIVACSGDGESGNVIIKGKCTVSGAGTFTISNVQLQTNSDFALVVSGSSATVVQLESVYINCTNNTGISYTTSSTSSSITARNCSTNLGTTGIALYSMSSTGNITFFRSDLQNTGASTTASSNSAGTVIIYNSTIAHPLSTSSTGVISAFNSTINTAGQNVTAITSAGTGVINGWASGAILSGTASAVSVGAGTTITLTSSVIVSSNTNAITGAGTLNYVGLSFVSSATINVTTQSGGLLNGGVFQAPSAGFIGEQIRSYVAAVAAAASATAKDLTSISLTPGIWDCTLVTAWNPGSGATSNIYVTIGTTSATLGTFGDNFVQVSPGPNVGTSGSSACVPSYRLTLTATTTVYAVIQSIYAGTAPSVYGRLSATRVG